jgi:NTP pyrophosphatase (non-canonical NTP hydrolase)
MITFKDLEEANKTRIEEWPGHEKSDLEFRTIELAGEAGEVANAVKKYLRAQRGIHGNTNTVEDIADELGDVVICCQLIAEYLLIDLGEAVKNKFNKTSRKYGLETEM